jgi:dTDP-4-amino-4,6-dideoxygalactose transaminase
MKKPAIEGGRRVRSRPLPFSPPDIGDEEVLAVSEVLRSGWITTGPRCNAFEQSLTEYTGAAHGVVLSSATAGLFLCLLLHGIGTGDEVITSPYTFAATANVIIHTGATPVFADVDEDTMNISPSEIVRKITPRTRAVIPVHFAGHPAALEEINRIADMHGILVVEDAAHALGASYQGSRIGKGGNPAVFSFHAVKNLTTAEGGAVLTDDEHLARQLRLYALHGQTKDAYAKLQAGGWQYDVTVPGYKYNMTDLQAALGLVQLKKLNRSRKRRETISKRYDESLGPFEFVTPPVIREGASHARHLYPLRIDFSHLRIDRDRFIQALKAEHISANVHYRPVHAMSYFRDTYGYEPYDFPVAYNSFTQEVSLPLYPHMSDEDVNDVIEALIKLLAYYGT